MRLAVDNPSDPLIAQFEASTVHQLPLAARPFVWRDPATLPPRPWLLGLLAQVGYVTAIVSPGGVGKTGLAIAMGLSIASGSPLLQQRVWRSGPVWIWNLEDGTDELDKRMTAAIMHHKVDMAACKPLYLNSGRDRPLVMAAMQTERGADGAQVMTVYHPDEEAIIREARARGVIAIVVDPFVHSHTLNENDNPAMAAAMAAWGRVGQAVGCAIILVHHTRKGALGGNIEDGRGASSIAAAARVGLTLARMDEKEGERFDVPADRRWRYVRVDDAKASQAPRADKAQWLHLASVELGNGNATYPNGDSVQVVEPWTPPDVFDELDAATANRVLDKIAEGPKSGTLYTLRRGGKGRDRWAGNVLVEHMDWTDGQAALALATWVKSGLLIEVEYRDTDEGKTRKGVRVDATKRPTQ